MVKNNISTFTLYKTAKGVYLVKTPDEDYFNIDKTYHYIKYDYTDGFGFLSEYVQGFVISEIRDKNNTIELSENLKTYDNGKNNLVKRKHINRIYKNSFNLSYLFNKYKTEFWKNIPESETTPFDFEKLENFKIMIE